MHNYTTEIIVGAITLFGIFLIFAYRPSFKKAIGSFILDFTTCMWIAYIFWVEQNFCQSTKYSRQI